MLELPVHYLFLSRACS